MTSRAPGCRVVRAVSVLLPAGRREEWRAEWCAELEHAWSERVAHGSAGFAFSAALVIRALGAIPDAIWLRRHHGGEHMLEHDLRYAIRSLAKRPGFSLTVILTLALCIGATTAIFSVVNAVLLQPLPFAHPERLVMLWSNDTKGQHDRNVVSYANYNDWRAGASSIDDLGAYFGMWNATITGQGDAERIVVAPVTSSLFPVLGVAPVIGRGLLPGEDHRGSGKVVVLSYAMWQGRFGGDHAVLGRSMTLDGERYTIVGVMPSGFQLPGSTAVLYTSLPMLGRFLEGRQVSLLSVIARLKPGVTIPAARGDLATVARRLETQYPESNEGWGVTLIPLAEQVSGDIRRALLVLLTGIGFVLLIGCANVANLTLTRAIGRQRELAVRIALGARRGRLVRQMMTESALLALVSGLGGVVVAIAGVRVLVAVSPATLPRYNPIAVDARALGFAAAISLAAAMLFGLAPALQGSAAALGTSLKEGARGTAGPARRHLRQALVIGEIAIAVVLLIGAGLVINSFARLRGMNPGFRTEQAVAFKIALPSANYPSAEKRGAFFGELLSRVRAIPTVTAAGAITRLPMHDQNVTTSVLIDGREVRQAAERPGADLRFVTAEYFRTMGIPLLAGRGFTPEDSATSPAVMLINEAMAKTLWPGASPIGAWVKLGPDRPENAWITVVGVVGSVRDNDYRHGPNSQVFLSTAQQSTSALSIIVRAPGAPDGIVKAVRREVRGLDPNLPVYDVVVLDRVLADATTQERFTTSLLAAFSLFAVLLAAIGVYGVMAYSVAERTQEIGIRMAFGAQLADIESLVMRDGAKLILIAVVAGLLGALGAARVTASLLFEVSATDATTYAVAASVLSIVAGVACYLPARRAAKISPTVAMRTE
ncbi:MAG: ABC transporter permease [Gemmatimonadota bacterium]|nr:ABC transporter permease [Gemmatimonadota bacterium]